MCRCSSNVLANDPGSMQDKTLTTDGSLPSLALSPGNGNPAWFWKRTWAWETLFRRADGSSKPSGNGMSKTEERYPRHNRTQTAAAALGQWSFLSVPDCATAIYPLMCLWLGQCRKHQQVHGGRHSSSASIKGFHKADMAITILFKE